MNDIDKWKKFLDSFGMEYTISHSKGGEFGEIKYKGATTIDFTADNGENHGHIYFDLAKNGGKLRSNTLTIF